MLFTISVILVTGCLSLSNNDYPKFLSTNNEYNLEIQTNTPLNNATFYLPLPMKNGMPMVGNRLLIPNDFKQEGYFIAFTRSTPWLDINVTHPGEYLVLGNDPCFVRIYADLWPNGSYRVGIHNGTHDLVSPMLFINTFHPVGNESIILPKWDFSPQQPIRKPLSNPFSDFIGYTGRKNKQSTWIYSDYSADPNSLVTVSIQVKGTNQWLDDYDTWLINNYDDFFFGGISGEPPGEHLLNGEFTFGDGNYPDLSSSKWQQFIQRNQQGASQK